VQCVEVTRRIPTIDGKVTDAFGARKNLDTAMNALMEKLKNLVAEGKTTS
jgi:hypothetical protein